MTKRELINLLELFGDDDMEVQVSDCLNFPEISEVILDNGFESMDLALATQPIIIIR